MRNIPRFHLMMYFLVIVQFTGITVFLCSGPLFAGPILIIFQFTGILLGFISIIFMKPGNFNISAIPKPQGILIVHGPYKYIRHPMYTSILLFLLPLLIEYFSIFRLFVFIILLVILLMKLHAEEGLLVKKFDGYSEYQKETKKIIPYIY